MKIPPITYVPDKYEFLIRLAEGRRVLHVGCADALADVEQKHSEGRFLHARLAETAKDLWGCDLDPEGIARMREIWGFRQLSVADAQDLQLDDVGGEPFDLVIAAEVIEHLTNPGGFLASMRRVLAPGGELCITTPNGALSLKTLLHSLRGEEMVAAEHVVLFSFTSLNALLERFGYQGLQWHAALERSGGRRNVWGDRLIEPIVRRLPQHSDCLILLASPSQRPRIRSPETEAADISIRG
jgi:SAM-dependent methyltransferase